MPNPRKSLTAARLSGAFARNPKRYKNRVEPIVDQPLGEPPEWMNELQAASWRGFETDLPWLNQSHRSLVEIAATVAGRMRSGAEVGVNAMNLLRLCLGQMGATPADNGKVAWPVEGDDEDDLLD